MKSVIAAVAGVFLISFAAHASTAQLNSGDDIRVHAGRFGFVATEEPAKVRLESMLDGQKTVTEVTRVAGMDGFTGTDRVMTSVRITSQSGELLFAEDTFASPSFDARLSRNDDETPTADRHVAAATSTSPSVQSLLNLLGTYVQARNVVGILTSVKKLQTYLVDKALAPIVKNIFQQRGYYCAPVPRWWLFTDTMWYVFTCFGVAS